MSLFDRREQIYGPETLSVGDFDPTVDGCYRNVVTIPLDVRPHRKLRVRLEADNPVDIVVAGKDQSTLCYKEGTRNIELGPFDTGKWDSMGLLIGVYKGDKARVTLEAWIDKE